MVSPRVSVVAVSIACACGRTALGVGDGREDGDDDDAEDDDRGVEEPPGCDFDDHFSDCDGDGIPDADDPFPDDRDRPGRAQSDLIYLQSSTTLSTFDPRDPASGTIVADFSFPGGSHGQITDIAIDRFGVIYAIASATLHACHPNTAECWALAELSTNSLGFVPIGILDAEDDVLVTLAGSTWMHVGLRGPEVAPKHIAEIDAPYSSSGDIATTIDDLTVFTSPSSQGGDVVVAIDPATATLYGEVGLPATPYQIWGVVAYDGALVLCDQLGSITSFDPTTGSGTTIGVAPHECWGAAAHPDLR